MLRANGLHLCQTIHSFLQPQNSVENCFLHLSHLLIQLQSLGATSALILFEGLPELPADDATHMTFLIGTNRGQATQMTLELPAGWAAHRKGP